MTEERGEGGEEKVTAEEGGNEEGRRVEEALAKVKGGGSKRGGAR